jgi:TRAP-type transport system periplasmic protein
MFRRTYSLFLVVALFVFIGALPVMAQAQKTINLDKTYEWKMTSLFPSGQRVNSGMVEFVKLLQQRTNGKVKITFYEGTLGAITDHWEMLKGNAIQFAFTGDSPNIGRTPILTMVGLPMEFDDSISVWVALNELYKAGYLKELTDNFKVLSFQATDPFIYFFSKKKISKLEDWKGLKVRCGGSVQCMATSQLGASGVAMAGSEAYMALQTGVIEGTLSGIETAYDRKYYEPCKYALKQTLSFGALVLLMNKGVWNSLPPDLQNVIEQTAQEVNAADVRKRAEDEKMLWAEYGKRAEVYTISKEEAAKWKGMMDSVSQKYVQDAASKGYPAKEALQLIRKVAASSKK